MNKQHVYKSLTLVAALALGSLFAVEGGQSTAAEATTIDLSEQAETLPTMPNSMTDAQMDQLTAEYQEGPLVLSPGTATGVTPFAAKVRPLCTQDTGRLWKRTSGAGYKYGTVGAKPSIGCNVPVTHLSLETTVYKKVVWGWSKVSGPFKNQNWGAKSLTQKSVQYVCKKGGPVTMFRVIANGSVTYPGKKAIAGGAYSESDKPGLPCS